MPLRDISYLSKQSQLIIKVIEASQHILQRNSDSTSPPQWPLDSIFPKFSKLWNIQGKTILLVICCLDECGRKCLNLGFVLFCHNKCICLFPGFRAFTTAKDGSKCLAMEYGGEQSLNDLIEKRKEDGLKAFPAANIEKVALHVARGLQVSHGLSPN